MTPKTGCRLEKRRHLLVLIIIIIIFICTTWPAHIYTGGYWVSYLTKIHPAQKIQAVTYQGFGPN